MDTTNLHRPLLVIGALATAVGGNLHPEAPEGLSFRDNLVAMMDDGAWVPGHAIATVGLALIAAGLLVARRNGAWPAAARLLPFAALAAAAYALEMAVHTAAVVDQDRLAEGGIGIVAGTHLALAVLTSPVFGLATVALAVRLVRTWAVPLRPFALLGVIGGVATTLAAPLTVGFQDPEYAALFPIAGIGTSVWFLVAGLAGLRQPAHPRTTAAATTTATA